MSYNEQLQLIVSAYREAGQPWPATSHEIAAWAIDHERWAPQRGALIDRCAEELARAMREEYITDPQGRKVRAKHAAKREKDGHQGIFWEDMRTASREHMEIAFQQRRQQIVGDCRQLKADLDSFNDNYNSGESLQMVFDFTNDLAEIEALAMLEAV